MANPFRPGTVYYADVSEDGLYPNESRNNPGKGPRPWLILFSRHHNRTGTVIAAPLHSRGDPTLYCHVRCSQSDCDGWTLPGTESFIKLEQLRALDKGRLDLAGGVKASLRDAHLRVVRENLMGMFEPRLLPKDASRRGTGPDTHEP